MKAFRARNSLDVRTGVFYSNLTFLLQDNYIAQMDSSISIPKEIPIVELPELTLLPGLIDCHTHITYHYDENGKFGSNQNIDLSKIALNLQNTLNSGFTTIRDMGASNGMDIKIRDMNFLSPKLLVSGEPLFSDQDNPLDRIYQRVNTIKIFNDGQFTAPQIYNITNTAHKYNLPVAVHAFDTNHIIDSVLGNVDSIEHGSYLNYEAADLMRERNITLVPTLSMPWHYLNNQKRFNFSSEDWQHFRNIAQYGPQAVRIARERNVNICSGSDAVAGAHGHNVLELLYLNNAGLTPLECIQSATINPQTLLRNHRIGELKPGYPADIIGVLGNPLEDLRYLLPENVKFVMKDGTIVKNDQTK